MLVLSRRVGESVVIGDDVVVTILELRGDIIRVGVDAPRHIQVRRQELLTDVAEGPDSRDE
jgi:carbon storage regulator